MTPDQFVDRFNRLLSWEDRYRYLIRLGRKLETHPEEYRDSDHLVPGCLSRVWLVSLGSSDEGLFEGLDLGQHLSVNRRNGFYSVNRKIREHAALALAAEG